MTRTKRAHCDGCNESTVHEATVGYDLPKEIEGPTDETPVWLCRLCDHVSPRRVLRTARRRLLDELSR